MKFKSNLVFLLCIMPVSITLAMNVQEVDYSRIFQQRKLFNPESEEITIQKQSLNTHIQKKNPEIKNWRIFSNFENDSNYMDKVTNGINLDIINIKEKKEVHKQELMPL